MDSLKASCKHQARIRKFILQILFPGKLSMGLYEEIDFFRFAAGLTGMVPAHHDQELILNATRIVLCNQLLFSSTEFEHLTVKNIKGLVQAYPRALEVLQKFNTKPNHEISGEIQTMLTKVWSLKEMESKIKNFIGEMRIAYRTLHYTLLENIHGHEKMALLQEKFWQISSGNKNQVVGENQEYTREDLWKDEIIKQPVPLNNVFQQILEPSPGQKRRISLGQFPFTDTQFTLIQDLLRYTPSIQICTGVFDLIKNMVHQKYGEAAPEEQADVEGFDDIFNDSFHVAKMQEFLYVHVLIREGMERYLKANLISLLQLQYRRYSFFQRILHKAYHGVIAQYHVPLKHQMREFIKLEEWLQFVFQVARVDAHEEDVDLPVSLKSLTI
ncbi:MAG: hypothetical protein HQM11_14425 [SAR324 cluster bacterium]|nr:hypothetical protein [SAR324 cluster bacterium]